MKKTRVVIIDDERKAINVLQVQLERYFTNVEVVATCSDSEKAVSVISDGKPDLLFLDIEMPNKSGFDVLLEFENRNFEVVFVTAYDQYAIDAFKQNAIGYILKPVDSGDFIKTVTTALIRIAEKQLINTNELLTNIGKSKKSQKYFTVPSEGNKVVLSQNDIIYCKADGSYCEIITREKKYLVSKNLKHILITMPEWNFLKVNRSYVINPNHIIEFTKKNGGEITLLNHTTVSVSNRIRTKVFKCLKTEYNIF